MLLSFTTGGATMRLEVSEPVTWARQATLNSGAASRLPGTFAALTPDWSQSPAGVAAGSVMVVEANDGSGVSVSWNGLMVTRAASSSSETLLLLPPNRLQEASSTSG